MPRPKIRPVSPDEVKITRNGDTAIFTYADEKNMGGGMNLQIGDKIHGMTDADLLKMHNEIADDMIAARMNHEHVAIEVPIGKPQIKFDKRCNHWLMKGDVLRCFIGSSSDTDDGLMEPEIEVDDQKLSWKEFGRLLVSHEGWGMRLAIVCDDEMHEEPVIVKADSRAQYMEEHPNE